MRTGTRTIRSSWATTGFLTGTVPAHWERPRERASIPNVARDRDAQYDFTSKAGVKADFKSHATVGGVNVNARLGVIFSREDLVFFNAAGCTLDSVEDQDALGRAILDLYSRQEWDADHAVVTSLMSSKATTIFVSSSATSSFALGARSPRVERIDLSDASIELQLAGYTDVGLKVVAEKGLNPLLGLSKIRPTRWPFRRHPKFEPESLNFLEAREVREISGRADRDAAMKEVFFGNL